tara:strand:+ start:10897 stop:11643 length:747 start_codon:yes stop_codon:yes gene_type:complete
MEEQTVEETVETTEKSETLLTQTPPELQEGEYYLSEGVKGTGEIPEWYKADKYKSVAEQAKAYPELLAKFGGFTGAPKDGYERPANAMEDDALYDAMNEYGTKYNMSAEAFKEGWELLTTQAQVAEEVTKEEEMAKLGNDAGQRINSVNGCLRNGLDNDDYQEAADLITNADNIRLVELVRKALSPAKLPIEGGESPAGITWEDIEVEMFKKTEDGQMLRSVSPEHEKKVQRMMREYGGDLPNVQIMG